MNLRKVRYGNIKTEYDGLDLSRLGTVWLYRVKAEIYLFQIWHIIFYLIQTAWPKNFIHF